MVDSVALFPLGYRFEDPQGVPYSGALVEFFDAGTTTPKTVYADKDLTVELGTSVTTDSTGRPTSDGTTPTDIFVGTAPYKYVLKDADGVEIETKDNRPGAPVSASSVDVSVTATFPIVTKSLAYAVVAADQNTTFLINCSSADVTLTLPSATDDDIPNGWKIKVQHAGSANQAIVVVKSGSGQSIYEGTKAYGGSSIALALNGEDYEITADGGNWRVTSHTPPFIKLAQGIIPVVSRVSTSPASPQAGDIYLLTGVGGDFSTFTTGDLAQYTGAGWINWTPKAGWRVWVAGESLYYSYISSAWAVETGTASQPGTFKAASQSVQETGTANDTAVTPGTQHYHPGHPKAWGYAKVSGGSPSLTTSYNMSSVTDAGDGVLDVNIATDFSSANWSALLSTQYSTTNAVTTATRSQSAGAVEFVNKNASTSAAGDPDAWSWAGFGDQ